MIERMRAALLPLLPEGAFLRLDRGEALFVTDAPRRGACPDFDAVGFLCRVENGLAYLAPGPEWLLTLEAEYPEPPNPLCASLKRFDGPPDDKTIRLFCLGLKQPGSAAYDRRLRQLAAATLRKHEARGGLYACGLVQYLSEKQYYS